MFPDPGGPPPPDTVWRRNPEAGHAPAWCQGPGAQLLRSVSVRGRNVTFAVSFFLLITIIIIIIIIFIIIMNTVTSFNSKK